MFHWLFFSLYENYSKITNVGLIISIIRCIQVHPSKTIGTVTSTFKILRVQYAIAAFFTECSPDTCWSVCLWCSVFHSYLHHIGPISSRYKVEGQTLFLSKVETLLGHLHVSFETAEHIKEQKIRDMQRLITLWDYR